jgi:uncharacterized protein with PIN domain
LKFLADGMLGKLARWMRMLGHDVIYLVEFDDSELLELAKKEERILLTKDLELYKRAIGRGLDSYYVEGKTEPERVAEVVKRYSLPLVIDMDKCRCPICNTKLASASKEQLQNELEKNTFTYYYKFWKCSNCGQIYWQGAHWIHIINTLNQAKAKLEKLKENNGA